MVPLVKNRTLPTLSGKSSLGPTPPSLSSSRLGLAEIVRRIGTFLSICLFWTLYGPITTFLVIKSPSVIRRFAT